MEYQTTIKIDHSIKSITFKPVLYMDSAIWEITLDGVTYILRKGSKGWEQSCESELDDIVLSEIGLAIDSLTLKEAG